MKGRRRIRGGFETLGMRAGLALVPRLPRSAVVRLARQVGAAAYAARGRLRNVGEANIGLALGHSHTPPERAALLKCAFQAASLVGLDLLWFARDPERRIPAWIEIEPDLEQMLNGRAQILITGHHGNWELMGQAIALRGYPLSSVATPLSNPAVDRLLVRARAESGQEIVPREGAVLRLLRRIRSGGKIALLLDQNTLPKEGGVFVDFFGVPVPVSRAPALLALRTGTPIGFAWALPRTGGRYRGLTAKTIDPREFGDRATPETILRLTQAITARLEDAVRRWPEHWVWMYKRWKHIPPGTSPDGFPFYAKPFRPPQA